ncbi:MAG: DEAD/DEAH box helicase family protein [Thermoguttaceae bacterium]
MPETEADTCRKYVLPNLYQAGWTDDQINEQHTFTDGRVIAAPKKIRRGKQKRADYRLRYTRDFPIAIVEAKASYKTPGEGLQQAKDYAECLDLKFAFATNGKEIIEFDFLTGIEKIIDAFPTPAQLWSRLRNGQKLDEDKAATQLLTPCYHQPEKHLRYYQEIAIHRAMTAILTGQRRVLLTMATGTGKTLVAFQICWKFWNALWNKTGEHRRPKILYLADRNILIDDPKDKTFAPFGDARWKIANGQISKGREMYFAIYQAIAEDERRPGLYKEYPPDFFDLIIVDECHRGSARDESSWREILEYFEPAFQIGMTATPKHETNVNTYAYFGNPVYTYSLRQGIDDGFLAPYRVHRIVTTYDAVGWRPTKGEMDRYGREIPDEEYQTKDFERAVALQARTKAIARNITDFLKRTDRFGKTIVFCVDQEHADEMRRELSNLNADLVRDNPNYVCRVTSDEGDIGKGYLSNFQDVDQKTPVILTTSQLLTTGVDAPTCKNVVLARVVNSIVEFKQIIGRGTRLRDDYNKYFFNILDFTQSTRLFADPEFDGDPTIVTETTVDDEGVPTEEEKVVEAEDVVIDDEESTTVDFGEGDDDVTEKRRKFYVDGGHVEIAAQVVYELDPDGNRLKVVKYTEYTADKVRSLFPNAAELRKRWANVDGRNEIVAALEERGIDFDELAEAAKQPDADPFDLLCHLAFNAPLRTRRERAERLKTERKDFFEKYSPEAKTILNDLLEKYAEHGTTQFTFPDILKVPPLSEHGTVIDIVDKFGGVEKLKEAVAELQTLLYAAA